MRGDQGRACRPLRPDAKRLIEDEETGAKGYRYVRTGTNHYSLAFTYDWLASEQERKPCVSCEITSEWPTMVSESRRRLGPDAPEWPPRWHRREW